MQGMVATLIGSALPCGWVRKFLNHEHVSWQAQSQSTRADRLATITVEKLCPPSTKNLQCVFCCGREQTRTTKSLQRWSRRWMDGTNGDQVSRASEQCRDQDWRPWMVTGGNSFRKRLWAVGQRRRRCRRRNRAGVHEWVAARIQGMKMAHLQVVAADRNSFQESTQRVE